MNHPASDRKVRGSSPLQSTGTSASSPLQVKRFSLQVNKSETSGPIVDQFNTGAKPAVLLGLSPTSSSTNRARLSAILEWLIPRAEHVTILDGWWFRRWDLVAFDGLRLDDATQRVLFEMRRLHRRICQLAADFSATDRVTLVPWPETYALREITAIREDLRKAADRSPTLSEALEGEMMGYLRGLRKHNTRSLSPDRRPALLNYVVEEVGTFVYLSLRVSSLEVYPGPDLPLMRRLAAREFLDVFPYDLSQRSHLSLELIELAAGSLREGTASDWPEVQRLIRAWPTHFVEQALSLVREDFYAHHTTLCEDGAGHLLGFMIWRTDSRELELLWMAVDPIQVGRGIGRSIVQAVLCQRSTEYRVFGRTATTDSVIPNSAFSGAAYARTHRFFQGLGFTLGTRHERYWASQNHMIELEKIYGH